MFDIQPGTLIQNRYEVLCPIGRGGMGAVYKATDHRLKSTVALKQTLVSEGRLRKAFEHEAQILANLRHPALTKVTDHFTEDTGQFLVMEFIDGNDLGELLENRGSPFPLDEVIQWSYKLLDALDYIHTQSVPIIHRDIKPQNLKLTQRGEIILLDFGLAKGSVSLQSRVSSGGSIFGYTPKYAPLEQVQGTGTDPRSDLYALAATMYHLLTNTPPVDALARAASFINNQPDPQRAAHIINPAIPEPISQCLAQTMSLRADERPATAKDFLHLLQTAYEQSNKTQVRTFAGDTPLPPTQLAPHSQAHSNPAIPDPQGGYTGATIAARQPEPGLGESTPPASYAPHYQYQDAYQQQTQSQQQPQSQPPQKKKGKTYCLWGALAFVLVLSLVCVGLFIIGKDIQETSEQQDDLVATARAKTDSWQTYLVDGFDQAQYGWSTDDPEYATFAIEKGIYRIEAEAPESYWWWVTNSANPTSNAAIRLRGKMLTGNTEAGSFGILFHFQDKDNFLSFRINGNQQYQLFRIADGTTTNIIEWKTDQAISLNDANTLEVLTDGATCTLFINDTYVAQVEDDTFTQGTTGILIELPANEKESFAFDIFSLRVAEDDEAAQASTMRPTSTPLDTPVEDTEDTEDTDGEEGVEVFDTVIPDFDTVDKDESESEWTMPVTEFTLSDTFDSNDTGWYEGVQETSEWWLGSKTIANGVYVWDMEALQGLIHHDEPAGLPPFANFTARVSAQRLSGPEVSTIYSIVFRQQSEMDSFYIFRVADDNTFAVSLVQGGEWIPLIDWQTTDVVLPSQPNQLEVQADGSSFLFFINGQQVGAVEDSTLADGYVGLALELDDGDAAVIQFDDFFIEAR